eukprot:TRINITY_DN2214_c1_g4_i1.p1 TRINITY_DN2214_c1_g4~~TRINITY_DN2214_c1_g4_i1.p1  ORF type:complete len:569 (-),score=121.78 TRINITY_DN2214_c1_g4_i1:104-1810(-)
MAIARSIALVGGIVAAASADAPVQTPQARGKFLGSRAGHLGQNGLLDFDLLQDLEKVAGKDHREATEDRIARLEKALKPMFAAIPKMANGNLDATGVRYLLHRLFVQRHGWFVNGLDNGGESWNSTSPTEVFKQHAADHHSVFEGKLDQGFSIHQVAVFGAALEALVHGESLDRLKGVYRIHGLTSSELLSEEESMEAIRAYMVMYVWGADADKTSNNKYKSLNSTVYEMYPTFADTETFIQEIRNRILEDVAQEERNSWQSNLKVVEEVAERYGRWQDKECHVLKSKLMEMEQGATGRVPLSDFYAPSLTNDSWQFVESVPYLRKLGALDETNPDKPSVIIPNYLNAPANCVAGSKFYSVCCIDQCEDLLGHLETQVGAPEATAEQLASLVAALSSDTITAPRVLDESLLEKLREVATFHGGKVPLHGRLFAQWMHHAYPRECPYPHLSGSTNPLTQERWIEAYGESSLEQGEDEIRKLVAQADARKQSEEGDKAVTMPWSSEEELFVGHHSIFEVREAGSKSYAGRGFMLVLAPVAALAALAKFYTPNAKPKGLPQQDVANHKYFV